MFSIRWIISLAIFALTACLSTTPEETSQPSAETESDLFGTSAVSTIHLGANKIPARTNAQKTPIKVPGGLCMRMNHAGSEIVVSWKPLGCWGTGCHKIIEKKLHLRIELGEERPDCTTDPTNTKMCQPTELSSLHVSSSIKVERHPKRTICARDCSGLGRLVNRIAYSEASPINVFHKGRPVGRFDPTKPDHQCFRPIRNIYKAGFTSHQSSKAEVD